MRTGCGIELSKDDFVFIYEWSEILICQDFDMFVFNFLLFFCCNVFVFFFWDFCGELGPWLFYRYKNKLRVSSLMLIGYK